MVKLDGVDICRRIAGDVRRVASGQGEPFIVRIALTYRGSNSIDVDVCLVRSLMASRQQRLRAV